MTATWTKASADVDWFQFDWSALDPQYGIAHFLPNSAAIATASIIVLTGDAVILQVKVQGPLVQFLASGGTTNSLIRCLITTNETNPKTYSATKVLYVTP